MYSRAVNIVLKDLLVGVLSCFRWESGRRVVGISRFLEISFERAAVEPTRVAEKKRARGRAARGKGEAATRRTGLAYIYQVPWPMGRTSRCDPQGCTAEPGSLDFSTRDSSAEHRTPCRLRVLRIFSGLLCRFQTFFATGGSAIGSSASCCESISEQTHLRAHPHYLATL